MSLIDNFFHNKLNDKAEEKNNFYLGKVSSVYGSTFTFQTGTCQIFCVNRSFS